MASGLESQDSLSGADTDRLQFFVAFDNNVKDRLKIDPVLSADQRGRIQADRFTLPCSHAQLGLSGVGDEAKPVPTKKETHPDAHKGDGEPQRCEINLDHSSTGKEGPSENNEPFKNNFLSPLAASSGAGRVRGVRKSVVIFEWFLALTMRKCCLLILVGHCDRHLEVVLSNSKRGLYGLCERC